MTPKDATTQLINMGCKYLRVVDMEGDIIVAQNKNTTENLSPSGLKKQAERIAQFCNTAPNGHFVIQGKTSPQSKPTSIVYEKGEQGPAIAATAQQVAPSRPISDHENVLSYGAALKMHEELANLRAENTRLQDLVENLQGDLEELENEAAAASETTLGDSPAMGALGQLAGILPAIVDKWFEQQKEKNEIEKAKLMAMMQQQQRQNGQQYQE
jgi:hypothetical protein